MIERLRAFSERLREDSEEYADELDALLAEAMPAPPQLVPALEMVARAFVAYYTAGGGCSNCGGTPHATSCFVLQFEKALAEATPATHDVPRFTRAQVEQIMDALESDALGPRRAAFEMIQELHEPVEVRAGVSLPPRENRRNDEHLLPTLR